MYTNQFTLEDPSQYISSLHSQNQQNQLVVSQLIHQQHNQQGISHNLLTNLSPSQSQSQQNSLLHLGNPHHHQHLGIGLSSHLLQQNQLHPVPNALPPLTGNSLIAEVLNRENNNAVSNLPDKQGEIFGPIDSASLANADSRFLVFKKLSKTLKPAVLLKSWQRVCMLVAGIETSKECHHQSVQVLEKEIYDRYHGNQSRNLVGYEIFLYRFSLYR
jgi:hypothetical protein